MNGLPGHGPACGEDACLTCYLDAERDRLTAENERLRTALQDIACPPSFLASRSVLSSFARAALTAEEMRRA